MELIFAAACCSVVVSILLKWGKNKGFDPIQMISWNYASASLLCYVWFKPDLSHVSVSNTPWWLIIALGVLLPSVFLFLAKSLQYAGIVKTEIAQRLSVILSLLAAYFIFQEQFNQLKIIGVVLGLAAVMCILFTNASGGGEGQKQAVWYLALVWFGYALIDVLLKYTTGLGVQFSVALNLMFICAFFIVSRLCCCDHEKYRLNQERLGRFMSWRVELCQYRTLCQSSSVTQGQPSGGLCRHEYYGGAVRRIQRTTVL